MCKIKTHSDVEEFHPCGFAVTSVTSVCRLAYSLLFFYEMNYSEEPEVCCIEN